MDGAQLATLAAAIGLLVGAIVAAWISLRKSRSEIDQVNRNGVIDEWKGIVDRLEVSLEKCCEEGAENRKELKAQRVELISLNVEISGMQTQIRARETERITQRGEIRKLENTVAELETPDIESLAEAITPKLAEAMSPASPLGSGKDAETLKVEIVPGVGKPAMPVKETP